MQENLTLLQANNKGADQPVGPCSLISAFVFRFRESMMAALATHKISIFWLVSVAEQTGLNLTWADTMKTGSLTTRSWTSHFREDFR